VRVNKDVTTTSPLPGYVGTIREIVQCYTDNSIGYNLRLDDDPRTSRIWFFYHHQLTSV